MNQTLRLLHILQAVSSDDSHGISNVNNEDKESIYNKHNVRQTAAKSDATAKSRQIKIFVFRLERPTDNRYISDIWSWSVTNIDDADRVSQYWHHLCNDVFHAVVQLTFPRLWNKCCCVSFICIYFAILQYFNFFTIWWPVCCSVFNTQFIIVRFK